MFTISGGALGGSGGVSTGGSPPSCCSGSSVAAFPAGWFSPPSCVPPSSPLSAPPSCWSSSSSPISAARKASPFSPSVPDPAPSSAPSAKYCKPIWSLTSCPVKTLVSRFTVCTSFLLSHRRAGFPRRMILITASWPPRSARPAGSAAPQAFWSSHAACARACPGCGYTRPGYPPDSPPYRRTCRAETGCPRSQSA